MKPPHSIWSLFGNAKRCIKVWFCSGRTLRAKAYNIESRLTGTWVFRTLDAQQSEMLTASPQRSSLGSRINFCAEMQRVYSLMTYLSQVENAPLSYGHLTPLRFWSCTWQKTKILPLSRRKNGKGVCFEKDEPTTEVCRRL